MKIHLIAIILFLSLNTCKSTGPSCEDVEYVSNALNNEEILLTDQINNARVLAGLDTLEVNKFISDVCHQHNLSKMNSGNINHDGFSERFRRIECKYGKNVKIGEILAFNYKNTQSVISGWTRSKEHNTVLYGNYNTLGVSVEKDTLGNIYYSAILVNK